MQTGRDWYQQSEYMYANMSDTMAEVKDIYIFKQYTLRMFSPLTLHCSFILYKVVYLEETTRIKYAQWTYKSRHYTI